MVGERPLLLQFVLQLAPFTRHIKHLICVLLFVHRFVETPSGALRRWTPSEPGAQPTTPTNGSPSPHRTISSPVARTLDFRRPSETASGSPRLPSDYGTLSGFRGSSIIGALESSAELSVSSPLARGDSTTGSNGSAFFAAHLAYVANGGMGAASPLGPGAAGAALGTAAAVGSPAPGPSPLSMAAPPGAAVAVAEMYVASLGSPAATSPGFTAAGVRNSQGGVVGTHGRVQGMAEHVAAILQRPENAAEARAAADKDWVAGGGAAFNVGAREGRPVVHHDAGYIAGSTADRVGATDSKQQQWQQQQQQQAGPSGRGPTRPTYSDTGSDGTCRSARTSSSSSTDSGSRGQHQAEAPQEPRPASTSCRAAAVAPTGLSPATSAAAAAAAAATPSTSGRVAAAGSTPAESATASTSGDDSAYTGLLPGYSMGRVVGEGGFCQVRQPF